ELTRVEALLTFRDPRDAIASALQRFGPFGQRFIPAVRETMRNFVSGLTVAGSLDHLAFFYEDGFTGEAATVRRVAKLLRVPLRTATINRIIQRYSVESVRRFTAALGELPPDRQHVDGTGKLMDRDTGFNVVHLSDMRIGKWMDVLDAGQCA